MGIPSPDRFHLRKWVRALPLETVEAGVAESVTKPLLQLRPDAVPHLWGYRTGHSLNQSTSFLADNNGWHSATVLRTSGEDLPADTSPRNLITGGPIGKSVENQIIDYLDFEEKMVEVSTVGLIINKITWNSEWVPCDLVVPELWATWLCQNSDATSFTWQAWVVIDYTWEPVTAGELAAVNLVWGRDPGDFARSPGVAL